MSTPSDIPLITPERFAAALDEVLNGSQLDEGIGVLGERTLHAVLKRCYEPYSASREVKLGRFVADICGEDGIIEIQTGGLYALRPKLGEFLEVARTTVVHPLARRRKLVWVDAHTGERADGGTRTMHKPLDIFEELWELEPFLGHPNFALHLLMVDLDEYREFVGFDKNGRRRRGERLDRVPTAIAAQYRFERPEDYAALCPENLPESFGSAEFTSAAKISRAAARNALRILHRLGVLSREKSGNAYRYRFLW